LPIHENELVHKDDLLFRIDPIPYQTNVAAAEAQLALSRATMKSKWRLVSAPRSNAGIASEQTSRAEINLDYLCAEERLKPLTAKG
jgi:multidrug efflux system membrane fusion protein